jgi:hypothetical protein
MGQGNSGKYSNSDSSSSADESSEGMHGFILFYQTQKKIDEFENEKNLEDLFIAKRSGRIATTWLSSKYR